MIIIGTSVSQNRDYRNIKTEALGRSAGPVQNVAMALPNARSWKAIREELKRCSIW